MSRYCALLMAIASFSMSKLRWTLGMAKAGESFSGFGLSRNLAEELIGPKTNEN